MLPAALLLLSVTAPAAVPRVPRIVAGPSSAVFAAAAPGPSTSPAFTPFAPTPALTASLIPVSAVPEFRTSRDIARDDAAARLKAAGFPAEVAAHGLAMWHVLSHVPRSGEQLHLTFGLPPDGRPFERGGGDPARREELSRRLKAAEAALVARAAEILGKDAAVFVLHERLVEGCCGAGCQSCLLGNSKHAKTWTGLDKRPDR